MSLTYFFNQLFIIAQAQHCVPFPPQLTTTLTSAGLLATATSDIATLVVLAATEDSTVHFSQFTSILH